MRDPYLTRMETFDKSLPTYCRRLLCSPLFCGAPLPRGMNHGIVFSLVPGKWRPQHCTHLHTKIRLRHVLIQITGFEYLRKCGATFLGERPRSHGFLCDKACRTVLRRNVGDSFLASSRTCELRLVGQNAESTAWNPYEVPPGVISDPTGRFSKLHQASSGCSFSSTP